LAKHEYGGNRQFREGQLQIVHKSILLPRLKPGLLHCSLFRARRAGISWRTITHLEGGDRKQTCETILTLCGALEVECGEFAKEPATPLPERRRGRPTKAHTKAMQPKNPGGQPRKAEG
jgi:hypothetical protein